MADRWKLALLMGVAVVALAVGEAFIARGMKQAGESAGWWPAARSAIGNGWVVGGAALLVVHLLLYAMALARADLSLVMPITAASYPLGTILARTFLREEVNVARWAGAAIIAVGVAVVAWGESENG